MRTGKIQKPEMLLISIGLLITSGSALINRWLNLPDFLTGTLMGFGVGMEIVGLALLAKHKRSRLVN
ncbi:hypothetical protein [Mucilaginibacter boryungensis]|uniref:Uncharacterized protein n=1 Tax=Mucilaginibacter boryungensis TaxID=768480 RepID=A0ABR9XNR4_9SPHI|nr:hypothetical protein [Mucilaginibacter boryungensis]MBE9668784.1 hypothetical protein [Mucilaginibacter boryungensis]